MTAERSTRVGRPVQPPVPTCSATSLALAESLAATASQVRSWLLIEQPGPWGADALTGSRLPTQLGGRLKQAARRAGLRPLLIRRPGRDRAGPTRACFLVRSTMESREVRSFVFADPEELAGLRLDRVPADPAAALPDGPWGLEAAPDPGDDLFLVCTNGRHDQCCATFGRPLAHVLRRDPAVWESSHIGGDRFAGTMVALPRGVYYGRVPPDRAAEVVAATRAERVVLDLYRGRSTLSFVEQAAEDFVRRETGELGLDALALLGSRPVAPLAERGGGEQRLVQLARKGSPLPAVLVRVGAARPPRQLTCGSREMLPPVYDCSWADGPAAAREA